MTTPRGVEASPYTDKAVGKLVQQDGVQPELLRVLLAAFQEAQRQVKAELEPLPKGKFRKPRPGEPAMKGVEAGLARIDQQAAESEPKAEEMKQRITERGPDANAAEAAAGFADLVVVLRKIEETGLVRINLKPAKG
jgi:hypothetical protein